MDNDDEATVFCTTVLSFKVKSNYSSPSTETQVLHILLEISSEHFPIP
jgi:hypothetical protein